MVPRIFHGKPRGQHVDPRAMERQRRSYVRGTLDQGRPAQGCKARAADILERIAFGAEIAAAVQRTDQGHRCRGQLPESIKLTDGTIRVVVPFIAQTTPT